MPYDLYGNHYTSRRDALNAEMAQCAEIDARIANQKVHELEKKLYNQNYDEKLHYDLEMLSQYCSHLEERIKSLEEKINTIK